METQGKRRETGGELRKGNLALGAIEYSLYISSREGTLGNSGGTKYQEERGKTSRHKQRRRDATENVGTRGKNVEMQRKTSGRNGKGRDTRENVETREKTSRHERKGTSRHQSEGRDSREDIEK